MLYLWVPSARITLVKRSVFIYNNKQVFIKYQKKKKKSDGLIEGVSPYY